MPTSPKARSAAIAQADPGLARRGPEKLVLIAGGGIAGLTAALALARRGIASHVLERRALFAEDGAGIQIGPNGTRILAEIGVADALRPHVAVPQSLRVMDGTSGREITRLPLGHWMEERWHSPYWTVHRADLHAALVKSVRASALVRLSMGADIAGFSEQPGGIRLASASVGSWHGDALVAADGLWSTLRASISLGRGAPAFTGRSALRTVIPTSMVPAELPACDTHIWLRPGAHVVHYPVRGGAEIALVLIVEDNEASVGWGLDVLAAWVHQRTIAFPEPLALLLSRSRSWRKWSLHALPASRSKRWVNGRAALIGDAAHPMLPFLAQGGVMALEDATVLARALAETKGDVPGALADYERLRRARTARVARASERNGRIYHLGGFLAAARDAVLGSVPPRRLMKSYDWLYGWKA